MAVPTTGWAGIESQPNAAHIYVQVQDSAGVWLSSVIDTPPVEDPETIACSIGLCKVINPEYTNGQIDITAENSKGIIKSIEEGRKISIEVEALVGTNPVRSLCHGEIDDYNDSISISDSQGTLTGAYVELYFMKDESDWNASVCKTDGGYVFPNCTIIPLGEGMTIINREDRKTFKFRIIPSGATETVSLGTTRVLYKTIPPDTEIDCSSEFIERYV